MEFGPSAADQDYCYLTTTGRVSGEPREIEIWFGLAGDTPVHAVRRRRALELGEEHLARAGGDGADRRRHAAWPGARGATSRIRTGGPATAVRQVLRALQRRPRQLAPHGAADRSGLPSLRGWLVLIWPPLDPQRGGRTGMKVQSASVRRSAVAVLAAVCTAVCLPAQANAAPHRADGNVSDWRGEPTMLSGQTRISRGELIHDDWLYDDYGANLDGGPNNARVSRCARPHPRRLPLPDQRHPLRLQRGGPAPAEGRGRRRRAARRRVPPDAEGPRRPDRDPRRSTAGARAMRAHGRTAPGSTPRRPTTS